MFLSACSTSKVLEDYPKRWIDRPYTLPEGLANWKTVWIFASDQENGRDENRRTFFYPFVWEHALTEKWTLVWSPMPLEARYQIRQTKDRTTGISMNLLGFGYSSLKDFVWRPSLDTFERIKLGESTALLANFVIQPEIRPQAEDRNPWQISLKVGPAIQLSSVFAVVPRFKILVEKGDAGAHYLGSEPPRADDKSIYWRLPMGLETFWKIHRQWEIQTEYVWTRVGYQNQFETHQVLIGSTYYW